MEYAVETIDLTKRFTQTSGFIDFLPVSKKKETTAIENVNLKIRKGELFGIVGPNGAGKTTLIKVLCTLILPTSGSAYVNGYDIIKEEEKARSSLGFVSGDERSFYWRLTGRQNLEFFAALNNFHHPNKKVNEVLDIIDFADKADNKFYTYSAGMKQWMAIARGLLNDPEVLFMDEPTKSLDPISAQKLRAFIKERLMEEQRKTVFLSTHYLEEAEQLCDRIAIIDKARIRACGTLNELRKIIRKDENYILEIKGLSKDALAKIGEVEGIVSFSMNVHSDVVFLEIGLSNSEVVLPQLIQSIVNAGGKIQACSARKTAFNEVFVEIVERGKKIDF